MRTCLVWASLAGCLLALGPVRGNGPPDEPDGLPSLDSRTFGGKQFWSDELVFHDWRIQRNALTGHCRLLDERNVRRAWGDFESCRREFLQIRQEQPLAPLKPRVVLVLHGLVRTRESMEGMCQSLRRSGEFSVLNVSYASSRESVAEHAASLAKVVKHLEGVVEISFVGHSLGNLVVRHYLHDAYGPDRPPGAAVPQLGRIVMLAPPNNGAQMARRFQDNPLFQTIWGTSGRELARQWGELAGHLATPPCEFGIIAGGTGKELGRNPLVAGDDDFVVAVEETRLAGAADFLVLPALHGTIMDDEKVQECSLRFLQSGWFVSPADRHPIPSS